MAGELSPVTTDRPASTRERFASADSGEPTHPDVAPTSLANILIGSSGASTFDDV